MDGHIDWLTWTMLPKNPVESVTETYDRGRQQLRSLSNVHEQIFFDGQGFDRSPNISNFQNCLERADSAAILGGRGPGGHMLFQMSGRGCDAIRERELSRAFVREISALLTRLDYAVDVRTRTRPADFANSRSHHNFRSVSFIKSSTGETVYVGSAKSDRFCRVYRYNPPHPRSELLRVEFVFRRHLAREAAELYHSTPDETRFHAILGNTYGWSHRDWQPSTVTDQKLRVPSIRRTDQDTLSWLYKQVAPAMRRLIEANALDMVDFLDQVYNNPE